ncbi:MAG: alanine racemase [Acidobacteriota bacterium]
MAELPRRFDTLPTPALLVDLDVLERNLATMAAKARRLNVTLRPHAKTHKCVEIARLQRDHGAMGLTVSTLAEAQAFARHGFDDLTWAFPLIVGRLDEVLELAKTVTLRVVVDHPDTVTALERAVDRHDTGLHQDIDLHVWLEVDCGHHRSGVDPRQTRLIDLARRLSSHPHLIFDGLLTHGGHGYTMGTARQAAEDERRLMSIAVGRVRDAGIDVPAISVGSTPTIAVTENLDGIDEIRPGNYVFHDLTQVALGTCGIEDCAATVLASVVSAQPGNDHVVVDAGALALSKDLGADDRWGYGALLQAPGTIDEDKILLSLSQEHGVLRGSFAIDERVRVIPNHSCLTGACFDHLFAVRGDEVVDKWIVHRTR